jgi:hypothetical protein
VPARQDELRVYGGLMALRLLARKYEFRDEVGGGGGVGGVVRVCRVVLVPGGTGPGWDFGWAWVAVAWPGADVRINVRIKRTANGLSSGALG